jgi:hypothetical protein
LIIHHSLPKVAVSQVEEYETLCGSNPKASLNEKIEKDCEIIKKEIKQQYEEVAKLQKKSLELQVRTCPIPALALVDATKFIEEKFSKYLHATINTKAQIRKSFHEKQRKCA